MKRGLDMRVGVRGRSKRGMRAICGPRKLWGSVRAANHDECACPPNRLVNGESSASGREPARTLSPYSRTTATVLTEPTMLETRTLRANSANFRANKEGERRARSRPKRRNRLKRTSPRKSPHVKINRRDVISEEEMHSVNCHRLSTLSGSPPPSTSKYPLSRHFKNSSYALTARRLCARAHTHSLSLSLSLSLSHTHTLIPI